MPDYTVESDPYLTTKTKADMAKMRADGVDLSLVDKFLQDTAYLVAPVQTPRLSPQLPLVVLAIIALVILCCLFP